MIIFGGYFIFMVYVMGMTAKTISDEEEVTFFKNLLDQHNIKRIKHKVQTLIWNTDMVVDAKSLLKIYDPNKPLPFNPKFGINTYTVDINDDFKLDAKTVVDSWYASEKLYDYDNPNPSQKIDSFTQLVWGDTKYISLALSMDEKTFKVLALYLPRGNYPGQYKTNVKRPPIDEIPFNPLNN